MVWNCVNDGVLVNWAGGKQCHLVLILRNESDKLIVFLYP